jgi:hypothetical protein
VIQDPDAPVSFHLAPGWTLTHTVRGSDHYTRLEFAETASNADAQLYYYPREGAYPADTEAALRQFMQAKSLERRGREGMSDYHVRPGSVQLRTVGGHPAIGFVGDYTLKGESLVDYTVRVLGKDIWAEFKVIVPAKEDIDDLRKRFDPMVNSLQIP